MSLNDRTFESRCRWAVAASLLLLTACPPEGDLGSFPGNGRGGSHADAAAPETGDGASERHPVDAPKVADASDAADVPDSADSGAGDGSIGASRAVAVSAGGSHSCALLSDGSARCWGQNDFGQLGSGGLGPSTCGISGFPVACSTTAVPVVSLARAVTISAGDVHTCAARSDGSVACWGLNDFGQLGIGNATGPSACSTTGSAPCAMTPVSVPNLTNALSVTASSQRSACALLRDGTISCWGLNDGQLGTGSTIGPAVCPDGSNCALTPGLVMNLTGATGFGIGPFHSCALLSNRSVGCWGFNIVGQLGDGSVVDHFLPAPVPAIGNAIAVATGGNHSCALLGDGSVRCWGHNDVGELGSASTGNCNSTTPDRANPCSTTAVIVSGLAGVTAITAGGAHTCALLANGTVACWGRNDSGQLGVGTVTGPSLCLNEAPFAPIACAPTPVVIPSLQGVTAISAGGVHTCATLTDGSVRCWGSNIFGQLGNGTATDSPLPVPVIL